MFSIIAISIASHSRCLKCRRNVFKNIPFLLVLKNGHKSSSHCHCRHHWLSDSSARMDDHFREDDLSSPNSVGRNAFSDISRSPLLNGMIHWSLSLSYFWRMINSFINDHLNHSSDKREDHHWSSFPQRKALQVTPPYYWLWKYI